MTATEVELFLNHLARDRQVSASTQTIALNAGRHFLYNDVLEKPLGHMTGLKTRTEATSLTCCASSR